MRYGKAASFNAFAACAVCRKPRVSSQKTVFQNKRVAWERERERDSGWDEYDQIS